MSVLLKRKHLLLIFLSFGLIVVCALGFVFSGVYDIAASRPHFELERRFFTLFKRQAVRFHARNLKAPKLNSPTLISRGFVLYERHCLACHGAPGIAGDKFATGLNPNPPPLIKTSKNWSDEQIAWIVSNGLKLAGMPAFELSEEKEDLWAMVAFIKHLAHLNTEDYKTMRTLQGKVNWQQHSLWRAEDAGWEELQRRGNVARGKKLVRHYGCQNCHWLPGTGAHPSFVGPPLENWRAQHYISGQLLNTPKNLVRWIHDPRSVEPVAAMPDLNVSEDEAWHIAAFLLSL